MGWHFFKLSLRLELVKELAMKIPKNEFSLAYMYVSPTDLNGMY